ERGVHPRRAHPQEAEPPERWQAVRRSHGPESPEAGRPPAGRPGDLLEQQQDEAEDVQAFVPALRAPPQRAALHGIAGATASSDGVTPAPKDHSIGGWPTRTHST